MSQTNTFSQPVEPLTSTPSRSPPTPALAMLAETVRRLRAEVAATSDPARQARLLVEIGECQEREGDDPGATRDYLAAYTADPSFGEPLEGLVRLLEKRRSLKHLGRLVDGMVAASTAPDERIRALLLKAAYLGDVAGQIPEALAAAREAADVLDAPAGEAAAAWLTVELLAGRGAELATRDAALAERVKFAADGTWRGLLLVDKARTLAARDRVDDAIAALEEARALDSEATWLATVELEALLRAHPADPDGEDAAARAEKHPATLEALATLVQVATFDAPRGDARGVPLWVRGPAHVVDAWVRAADERRALGRLDLAAAMLDRASDTAIVGTMPAEDQAMVASLVASRRIVLAEQLGDTALAAAIAAGRLALETDPAQRAALALRVAEHAITEGSYSAALEALMRAVEADPGSLPARAFQLDLLADGADGAAFATQLESFTEQFATDEARGRAFLLSAFVWGARARDAAGAKAALSQAAMFGVSPATVGRMARALASIAGDAAWYEDATKRLLAAGGAEAEVTSLSIEMFRLRGARGDGEGAARVLRELGATVRGAWLGRVLEAFLPRLVGGDRARASVEELAALETDSDLSRGLGLIAAMRAHASGDATEARRRLRELADRDPTDAVVGAYLGDLDRAAGDHAAAARVASDAATAATDPDRAAALRLEAAFERWREGDRVAAVEEMEAALDGAPAAARLAVGWASWGIEPDSVDARRRAIERAQAASAGADPRRLALERFALELGASDVDGARAALDAIEAPGSRDDEAATDGLTMALALGRLVAPAGASDPAALDESLTRVEESGPEARLLGAIERVRRARDAGDLEEVARQAAGWVEAGGGLPAALEWLGAATVAQQPEDELAARMAVAEGLPDDGREAMIASAALAAAGLDPGRTTPLVEGASAATRLVNLELSPPGCDPRRRSTALLEAGPLLGDEAAIDAAGLAGWALLAAGDVDGARTAFERAASAHAGDLPAWEGLRTCAEMASDVALRIRASSELGARCRSAPRGAAFWEEAATLCLEVGEEEAADEALFACFERDPTRGAAFDKLFRRVRARKDNEALLVLVRKRLEFTDDPAEIQKLFWEQARVLRESGDQDGALKSLEHVTMLDPDHVGALALLGEINIRRGQFDEAASALGRLAALDAAPAKNRLTAGVAAVDLYENKLGAHDRALEILLTLHRARLSNLPVRERLARAAARTGAWAEATAILEELMLERPEPEGRIEAARLAMAIHRDRLNQPEGARAAIVKLLEEKPGDAEAVDMLLQTSHAPDVQERLLEASRTALRESVLAQPTDVPAIRRLVRVARSLGDLPLQQAALGALVCLGSADSQADSTFAQLAAKGGRTPQVAVSEASMRAILAPGDGGPLADLFAVLGPTLAVALGPNLQACGVGRRDKVDPRSGIALRNEIAAWAGALGVQEFDLYVGGNDASAVQGVPGEPPALVVGTAVNAPLSPIARSRVARELFALVRGTTVARSRDDVTMAAIVVAACKLAEVKIDHPPYAVLAEVERLVGKEIARKTRRALPDVCRAIVAQRADAREWTRHALASHDRIAVLASGDPSIVLADVLRVPLDKLGKAVPGDARAQELLRFVLSPAYLDLRRSLGLEVGP
jgi:tetratricopeptide (TPR) repeat protein